MGRHERYRRPAHPQLRPSARLDPPPAAAGGIGVLLVNLGTPDATDAESVRRYLKEFLADTRVIEETRASLWKIVLNGIILRVRPRRKGRDYDKIWNREQERIAAQDHHALAGREARRDRSSRSARHVVVDWAMRYGNPSIASRLDALAEQGCERILVVPLYPQYCGGHHRDRRATRSFASLMTHAPPAGAARRAAVLRRPGLHRGARQHRSRPS